MRRRKSSPSPQDAHVCKLRKYIVAVVAFFDAAQFRNSEYKWLYHNLILEIWRLWCACVQKLATGSSTIVIKTLFFV